MFGSHKPSIKKHLPEHGLIYANRCDTMPQKSHKAKQGSRSMFVRDAFGNRSIVTVTAKQAKAIFAGGPTKIVEYMDISFSEGRALNVPKSEPCAVCYAAYMSHDACDKTELRAKCLSLKRGFDLCNVPKYIKTAHRHKKPSYVTMA